MSVSATITGMNLKSGMVLMLRMEEARARLRIRYSPSNQTQSRVVTLLFSYLGLTLTSPLLDLMIQKQKDRCTYISNFHGASKHQHYQEHHDDDD
jgi:hypothetical protein